MYRGSGRWVFQRDVFIVQKGLFATLIVENRFLRLIFTIYYMRIQGLQKVTGGYKGLQGVTKDYTGVFF